MRRPLRKCERFPIGHSKRASLEVPWGHNGKCIVSTRLAQERMSCSRRFRLDPCPHLLFTATPCLSTMQSRTALTSYQLAARRPGAEPTRHLACCKSDRRPAEARTWHMNKKNENHIRRPSASTCPAANASANRCSVRVRGSLPPPGTKEDDKPIA